MAKEHTQISNQNVIIIYDVFYLQVKDIYLHPDPFSVQNGLLTPTFKLKRPQIKNYFKPQLDDIYKNMV